MSKGLLKYPNYDRSIQRTTEVYKGLQSINVLHSDMASCLEEALVTRPLGHYLEEQTRYGS